MGKELSIDYRIYMESDAWKRVRQHYISQRGSECERCHEVGPVDLHHKRYTHFQDEMNWPADVELLCRRCHTAHHQPTMAAAYAALDRFIERGCMFEWE